MRFKRVVSAFLTLLFLLAASAPIMSEGELPFRDVPSNKWFHGAVKTVYEAGIMNGITEDEFKPNDPMTRGQFVTIIARVSGEDVSGMASEAEFTDTVRKRFYSDALGWAVKNGLINGYPEGTFGPDKPILRQEFAAVFVRYLEYKHLTINGEDVAGQFADAAKFPKFAKDAIETLRLTGLVKGDKAGNFNPKSNMTRAEIAQVIARFLDSAAKDPMYEALEGLDGLKCPTHRMIHYVAGRSAVETERADIAPGRMGAAFRDAMGLDPDTYEVKVAFNSDETLEYLNYEIRNSLYSEMFMLKISVTNVLTGETAGPKMATVMLTFDFTKDYDTVGPCPNELPDEKIGAVWSSLDDLYVFDDDGKIYVPYNCCTTAGELSTFFTGTLFGLDDDNEVGMNNGVYRLQLTSDDYANIGAVRDAGGEVTVTATLVNTVLGISSEPKELTLVIMNRSQCVEKMNALIGQLTDQMAELQGLMTECERAGIPTDYEYAAFLLLGVFADEHLPDYIEIPDFSRELFVRRSTEKMYAEAKKSLEKKLTGEKEAVNVPKFVSSRIDVDGFTITADTVDSYGNYENRPVYFFGYGDGDEYPWTYVPYYSDLGSNAFHYYAITFWEVVRPATPTDTTGISADGKYVIDTSAIERDLLYLSDLNDGDQAVSLMLVINAGSMIDIYPELGKPNGGEGGEPGFNLTHPKGREVVEAFLRAVIPLAAKYPCVNSFVISNEPAYKPAEYGDYYVPMWAEFLSGKYGTIDKLNEIYGADYASFEDVPLAVRDDLIHRDNLSLDNQEFATEVHADWHRWVAGIAHELAPDIPISTKLKSIEFDRSMQQYGLRPENWADFQDLGGCDDVRDDVMYYDHIAYAEDAPVVDSEAHMYYDSRDTSFTYAMDVWVERVIWRGVMHHLGIGNFYSDDYWPGYTDHFTFGNSAYRPLARYNIGKVTMDLNRLSYEADAIISAEPDVALLYSYPSRQFTFGDSTEVTNALYLAALRCGKKVRIISEDQIEKLGSDEIKVLLIGDAVNVTDGTLEAIDAFIARGGKVIIVGRDSLTRDENNVPRDTALPDRIKAAATVYGFRSSVEEYRLLLADYFKKADMQRVWIVDAATGEPVSGSTEWMSAEYDGRMLVTAYAMDIDEPVEVKVILDGAPVASSKELRSGEQYGETFTLVKNEAILLDLGAAAHAVTAPAVADTPVDNGFEYTVLGGGAHVVRYAGGATDVSIPDTLGGVPVVSVGGFAFTTSSPAVRSVTLPDSVTEIADFAFYKCKALEEVSLSPVKRIGIGAFCGCAALKNIVLPDSVTEIGDRAFCRCVSLENITFSQNTKKIGTYAFYGCTALTSLSFPDSLRRIGAGSFKYCSSVSGTVEIPWGVTEIPYAAFMYCSSIEKIVLPDSVIWIGNQAFEYDRSVTEIDLPGSLNNIGNNALTGLSLTRIDIPYGVTTIGSVHFYWPAYIPPTLSNLPDYWEFTAGVEIEAGSPYERFCNLFGIDYTIVEREHHVHTPGEGPTCAANQVCTECGAVIRPTYGHVWAVRDRGDGKAERYCTVCGAIKD